MLNWPNILTLLRILSAPVFLVFLLSNSTAHHTAAFFIFVGAIATDILDGYLARRLNCVTDFGKVIDPLADKVIVVTALVSFASLGVVPLWMVLAIVARELAQRAAGGTLECHRWQHLTGIECPLLGGFCCKTRLAAG